MENLFFYFGKMVLCSAVMFLYYRIFLKDKTFHHYNRFYLLGILAVSLLLPLLKVDYFTIKLNQNIYALLAIFQSNSSTRIISNDFSIYPIIFGIVAVLSIFFIIKFSLALLKIKSLKKEFPQENVEGISFFMTNLENAPFSFFKNLFWKDTIHLKSDLGKQILKHEMVHIEQRHSYDKIIIEIVTAIFWFNPIFYLIKKEINLIHEYLADKKALKNTDTKAFAQMLLEAHFSGKVLPATSPFLNSNLKKRIIMLKKSNTKFSYFRKVFALPLLFMLVFAYMVKAENREIEKQNEYVENISKEIKKTNKGETSIKKDTITKKSFDEAKENDVFVFEGKSIDRDLFAEKREQFKKDKSYYFTAYNNFLSKDLPVIFVGGKNKNIKNDDKFIGKIVAKVWDTPPAEPLLNENISGNSNEENADEKAIFIIDSEIVSKKEYLKKKKENENDKNFIFTRNVPGDKDHWIFGERTQYGVYQMMELNKLDSHNPNKFHQLVKKINPKWYFEQYINQKYTKRENERKRNLGLKENSAIVTVRKTVDDNTIAEDKTIIIKADKITMDNNAKVKEPRYFLDDKEITSEKFKNINPNDIKSVRVKEDGENGRIYIESRNSSDSNENIKDKETKDNTLLLKNKVIQSTSTFNGNNYFLTSENGKSTKKISDLSEDEIMKLKIYVNGKETDWKTLNAKNPNFIKQLTAKINNSK